MRVCVCLCVEWVYVCTDGGRCASAGLDWTLGEVVPIFSTTAVVFGCSVWGLGKYFEKIGPRQAGVMSAFLWGSGLAVSGLGTALHSLPMLYAGYGLLGVCTTLVLTSPVGVVCLSRGPSEHHPILFLTPPVDVEYELPDDHHPLYF